MKKRKKIATIYKSFEHKISFQKKQFHKEIYYKLFNFDFIKFKTKDQFLIYGIYELIPDIEKNEKERLNNIKVITKLFKEIINLDSLNIDNLNKFQLKVNLILEPKLCKDKGNWISNICNFFTRRQIFKIKGQLCFEVFKKSLEEEQKEGIEKKEIGGYDIICIASTRWDFIMQRPHHLMKRLSKNNRVLFFNHSCPAKYDEIKKRLEEPKLWEKQLTNINENLWVFSTTHLCPSQSEYLPEGTSLKEFNYKVKSEALKYLVNKLEFNHPVIITYLGESIKYIHEIPKKMLIYDCIDDFSSFSWSEEDTQSLEQELIKNTDLILASARNLYNKINKIHDQTFYLPNAVEFKHFAKVLIDKEIPQELVKIKKPIIGFVGAFYEWIDEELIRFIAELKPFWNFIFIGPIQDGMGKTLSEMKNVVFLKIKDYKDLPYYMSAFDVCLIPFKLNNITYSANPIKMWEYLATGKPIVSTPIPEVEELREYIYIGSSMVEFIKKIEEALNENDEVKIFKRITIAEKNDWDFRVNYLLNLIENYKDGESNENIIYQ